METYAKYTSDFNRRQLILSFIVVINSLLVVQYVIIAYSNLNNYVLYFLNRYGVSCTLPITGYLHTIMHQYYMH
jgi:hypothetical protein